MYRAPKTHRTREKPVEDMLYEDARKRTLRQKEREMMQTRKLSEQRDYSLSKKSISKKFPLDRLMSKDSTKNEEKTVKDNNSYTFKPAISKNSKKLAEKNRFKSRNYDDISCSKDEDLKDVTNEIYTRRLQEKQ